MAKAARENRVRENREIGTYSKVHSAEYSESYSENYSAREI
jgi:hypothetical protein